LAAGNAHDAVEGERVNLYTSVDAVPAGFGPSAVTIGKFDGMHTGHRRVIEAVQKGARGRDLKSVAVTFDRHPLSTINPAECPTSLLSNAQKIELLEGSGLDATVMVEFDAAFAALSPGEFVDSVLVRALDARVVFVGSDFRFGARGAGTVDVLRQLGEANGFSVVLIDEVLATDSRRASSTWVRELLVDGKVAEAAVVLGRSPAIRGAVVHGDHRGRELGYPTANLARDREGFVPADGVYAARLIVDGESFPAAVSIGNNPTFDGVPDQQVEAHILDASRDLYGKTITIEFIEYVRPMNKFADVDALVAQMTKDEQTIRGILGAPRPS
jgi:riboflavin kinase / FMN adenylyltransferase